MVAALGIARPVLQHAPRPVSINGVGREEDTDGDLIQRVGAGDRAAFEELYRRYTRPVLGLALRRLGDRGRAEDALQDAFAAIWRSARSFDPARGAGGAWLYTVARNAIVDGLRRAPDPTVDDPPEIAATDPGPPDVAEREWVSWRVHRAREAKRFEVRFVPGR